MEVIHSNLTNSVSLEEAQETGHQALVSSLASARFYISSASIFVALFGMGCVISIKDFSDRDTHLSKSVVIGLTFQSLFQPVIGYGLALLLDMSASEAVAMIMLACSPVSPLCAVLVYYGDGVVIVGMCMAMFSTALSVGLIPLWFSSYASNWTHEYFVVAIPFNIVMTELLIIIPTVLGVLYQKAYGKLKGRLMAKICSNAFWIAAVITPVLNGITNPEYYMVDWRIWVGTISLPPIGFVCGIVFALFASLPFNVCCAVSLAVGMPNVYIASQLSETYLAGNEETLKDVHGILTIFSLVMPLEGFIWAITYRNIEEMFLKISHKCRSCSDDDSDDDSDDAWP
ncbi:ileal sodium/bile acid cotransporter [Strongylocentrotus purpuratus]|uniref:Ileal sodium/bile acid cotransporter n=1 Tax=Strongylocentrotus purpuratus TaxID=7668 RepID=A0A7M7GKJ5_STRPU|nr:ileal sodium/bile acid cotransporter [Strongylocentrotus purpuratus]|eukprot:XP_003725700.1 PREDICTED: ileal sodium/bile acid cotransporter isoform X2 [Strongylocentrotus purpuratus]